MSKSKGIFDEFMGEWHDTDIAQSFLMLFFILILAVMLILLFQWEGLGGAPWLGALIGYIFLFMIVIFVALIDNAFDKNKRLKGDLVQFLGFGSKNRIIIGVAVGLISGFVLISSNLFTLSYPLLAETIVTASEIELSSLILFSIIFAPTVEEYFFRGFLVPTTRHLFRHLSHNVNNILAILLPNMFFSAIHYVAFSLQYGDPVPYLITSFVFGILMTFLAYGTKSMSAPITAHTVNNIVMVLYNQGVI